MHDVNGDGRPKVATIRLVVAVSEDHSNVTVSKVTDLPYQPSLRRFGHRRIGVGRRDLSGLPLDDVVALIGQALIEEYAPYEQRSGR